MLSTTNYIEGYETIDGYTVSAETLCGKAMNNTIYFRAYSMNGRYYLEMYSNVVNKQIEEIFS